jgi:rRNA maturation endonuclease Nob1
MIKKCSECGFSVKVEKDWRGNIVLNKDLFCPVCGGNMELKFKSKRSHTKKRMGELQ